MTVKWEKVGKDMPTNKWVYNAKYLEVVWWVEHQPEHMWKVYDVPFDRNISINTLIGQNYIFTDEMEAWFLLRWS